MARCVFSVLYYYIISYRYYIRSSLESIISYSLLVIDIRSRFCPNTIILPWAGTKQHLVVSSNHW